MHSSDSNRLDSYNKSKTSRNSLDPTQFVGISSSLTGIPSCSNDPAKSIELLEAPNMMRRVRSNSTSLFKSVRNSVSLGSGQNAANLRKTDRKISQKDSKKLFNRMHYRVE